MQAMANKTLINRKVLLEMIPLSSRTKPFFLLRPGNPP